MAERGSTNLLDPYAPTEKPADALSLVTQAIQRAEEFHTSWVDKIEMRYRAYRGIAEKRREGTPGWRSDLTTPYILQLIEGMMATMLDPKPTWEVEPRPSPGEPIEQVLARGQSAKVAGAALQAAMDADSFHLKQRPFMQQDLISGITVAKVVWRYECRKMNRLVPIDYEIVDDFGNRRDSYTTAEEQEKMVVLRDGPSMIVRDVRDFFWPESAKSVEDAAWVIDRTWMTYDELKAKQDAGLYRYVEELRGETEGESGTVYTEREQELWSKNRAQGLIEVLEYWTDDRMVAVGGRKVVLADQENPLQIRRKPFVVCSAMPDAFQMTGISVVESLAQVQEYLWTLQNQRIDALRLLTNVITLIRSDADDLDSFEFFPGAQWIVEDTGQVGQLQIDPTAAQITLEAESQIKGDLQNLMGGLPFGGGAESVVQGAGGSTATGMSIVTSIAQKMIQARKQQYAWAWGQVGELFLGMMGQMIREERTIAQIGPEGRQQLLVVHPLDLQGEFDVMVNVMDESTVRQERQTEAMALMNLAAPLAPMLGLDLKPFMEQVLESYGITNTERFFTSQGGQAQLPPGGTPQGAASMQEQQAPPGPVGSQGQTNPALAAAMGQGGGGALSLAPDQFAQQQLQAVQQLGLGAQG